jgi:hypothetical protein
MTIAYADFLRRKIDDICAACRYECDLRWPLDFARESRSQVAVGTFIRAVPG